MNPREYSTRPPARPAGPAVGDVMAAAAKLEPDGRGRFLAPPVLQSWPGIVHGGGLVALLDSAAAALGPDVRPRLIEGRLTSPVPARPAAAFDRARSMVSTNASASSSNEAATSPISASGMRLGVP